LDALSQPFLVGGTSRLLPRVNASMPTARLSFRT
jgi:hypothetical protein